MKPELIMCNYYGMCDENGESVGHAVKVTNEYSKMLKEKFAVKLSASPCIAKKGDVSNFGEIHFLKYDICIAGNGIVKRIIDKMKLLSNIRRCIGAKGTYFFYQVDFFFFFYILYFYRVKTERKLICLIYHQDFTGGRFGNLLQEIYKKALKKIDAVIYTQESQPVAHANVMWLPDFFYNEELYVRYQKMPKAERIVCVGTMNRYKQLEELVRVFAEYDIPLVIAGRFDEEERYQKLIRDKTDNIEIQNRNLAYEEYLELIATSKYSILPYDMEQYKNRTSGVLLETIYVGSVPIAPKQLLEQNSIDGIGYVKLSQLTEENGVLKQNYELDFQKVYDKYTDRNFVEFVEKWVV